MPSKISWTDIVGRATALFFMLLPAAVVAQVAPPGDVPFSADRIVIIPKAGHDAALAKQHAAERVKIQRKFPGLGNIHVLDLPKGADPQAVVQRYRRTGHVETADLDYRGWRPAATPNDPAYLGGVQWHLNNTGAVGGTPDADIDAPEAWDLLNSASNIIVAVIDTGVRLTHEDLAANLWTNPGEIPGDGIDNDGNGYVDDVHGINVLNNSTNIMDDFGHGSHVAGILGAVGNNGLGVCGVAWKVQIMPVKFYSPDSPSDVDVMEALDYARAKGAKVINFSFVAPTSSSTLSNAFWNVQNADIVLCAAAGNNGTDNDVTPVYPASYKMSNTVAVAATDSFDLLWSSSNYGSNSVHLAAPGVGIYSTFNLADNDYGYNTGTSMATPMVSGAAALLRARFTNETSPQIIARLLAGTDPLPSLAGKCISGGRLNLRKALDPSTLVSYTRQPAIYDWVPTNGMTFISLANDGVSPAQSLPFTFSFYGRSYSQLFIGANGLIGFTNLGLTTSVNSDLPASTAPNAAMYPYWDDLNPAAGGSVWFGTYGQAPNRKVVVSWAAVPHALTSPPPQTPLTFQAILHESGHIAFQYQQVETGRSTLIQGKSATIGVEDATGLFATKYTFNGSPAVVTNAQAMLFLPSNATHPAPTVTALPPVTPGQFQLRVTSVPAQSCIILASTNLMNWFPILRDSIPASGVRVFTDSNAGAAPNRFYRPTLGE